MGESADHRRIGVTSAGGFLTEVRGVSGTWPEPPDLWSYSSLRDAEECPRRWALARATYPEVWDRRGYPPRPIMPAVVGEIIHRSLDLILRTLYERGCSSISDPASTEALRSLGGYSALIEQEISHHLDELQSNPRMAERLGVFRTTLRSRLPEMRQRVQTLMARAALVPAPSGARNHNGNATGPMGLGEGSHPEVALRVSELRLLGRADLITVASEGCAIVDYKTGAPNEHHAEQVRVYQLLWSRDRDANPAGLPVTSLTLSYATHDVSIEPMNAAQLQVFADDITNRVRAVELEVGLRPPPARPEAEKCRLCSVRHLCDAYWVSSAAGDDGRDFVDLQGTIVSRNGPKSWLLDAEQPDRERILMRTSTEQPGFKVGETVRLLDAVLTRDAENDAPIVTMTAASEVFEVEDAA